MTTGKSFLMPAADLTFNRNQSMLYTIAIILLVLWALGFFVVHLPGLIHLVLVVALVVFVVQLLTGRRSL